MTRVAALLLALAAGGAAAADLHAYWDGRCGSCHGDSAAFARSTLALRDGQLVGRHHVDDLPRFLRQHGLAETLVEPVLAMLAAQVATPPRYAGACQGCHGKAAELARESLRWRDGMLVGRKRGVPVAELLRDHGGLGEAEQAVVVRTLERVRREVGG
ncbi:MAG: hypothetical protein HYZ20_01440 [Burkholderiales bacterium]|nr:hypothetical protein [Burkholderiales bacterium]